MQGPGKPFVLVNPLSGGGAGAWFQTALERHLGAERVLNVLTGVQPDPEILRTASCLIVAGGDGTVSHLSKTLVKEQIQTPIAMIPLGTGNDIARAFGWPIGKRSDAFVLKSLHRIEHAQSEDLDVWELSGPDRVQTFCAYWSMGYDAGISYGFDQTRRKHPSWCLGPFTNKTMYAVLGLWTKSPNLCDLIAFEDGISLSAPTGSIIAANIASYAGGFCLDPKIRSGDGQFDLLAMPRFPFYALALSGLRSPIVLSRGKSLAFRLLQPLPMQCDGEAFLAPAGEYRVRHRATVRMLRPPLSARGH
jgi:diacylglycerol kinase (ATP)